MREWKPEKRPAPRGMFEPPPPHFEFIELESARHFGYTIGQWRVEHPEHRARAVAHYLESKIRDSYEGAYRDAQMKMKSKGEDPMAKQQSRWGIG